MSLFRRLSDLAAGKAARWALAGLALGLAAGWLGWPRVAVQAVTQPVRFSHAVHAGQGVPCRACHFSGPGGAFSGLPPVAVCAGCHPEPVGGSGEARREIDRLVSGYVGKDREVPWLVLAGQPDHVLFTHAPHLAGAGGDLSARCSRCHPDVLREDTPTLTRSRISGRSLRAMPMDGCRACHRAEKAALDCVACHK